MRYVFISDVHGEYEKMLDALAKVNFNSELDTLVSLGDLFDRGPKSREVLEYVMGLPHKILLWGNHDLRLKELLDSRALPNKYDVGNGILATLQSLMKLDYTTLPTFMINMLNSPEHDNIRRLLYEYYSLCNYAVEFTNLIGTHAWLPGVLLKNSDEPNDYIMAVDGWRDCISLDYWYEATWSKTDSCFLCDGIPDKNLIVGHWHAWRMRWTLGELALDGGKLDCSTYTVAQCGKIVSFIDGCANATDGCVNCFVYSDDKSPIVYDGITKGGFVWAE